MQPDREDGRSRRVRRFVIVMAVVGGCCASITLVLTWRSGLGDLRVLALTFIALVLVSMFPLVFHWKGEAEHISIDEAFYVLLMMTSPAPAALAAMVISSLVGNVYHRRPAIKVWFNVGLFALAVSAAVAVTRVIGGGVPTGSTGRGIAGAAAGAIAFYVITTAAVRAVVAMADQVRFARLFAGMSLFDLVIITSSVSLGVLAGLASTAQSLALLFGFTPIVGIGFVLHQYGRSVQDRRQLDLLLETAVTASDAVGVQEVQRVILEATRRLLHTSDARIQLDGPRGDELGSRLDTDSGPLWLIVSPISRITPFTAADETLLDGLAAIASTSLASAELLDRVRHQAFHDSLTGLPNRFLFEDRLAQALRARSTGVVGVLFIDLDRFKRVNDNLGQHAGDELLRQVAERLPSTLRAGDSVARVGGDEFAVLLPGLESEEAVVEVAQRIVAVIREPYVLESHEVFVTASVGVAMSPVDGLDYASLLRSADTAKYEAKDAGRDSIRRRSARPGIEERFALEAELRQALARDELSVAYQPLIDLTHRRIAGAEALVRWHHPTRGPMTPDEFLPLAEESGLLRAIDEWVMRSACREAAAWRATTATDLHVSVNVSDQTLRSGNLDDVVRESLSAARLPASWLEIEVTEKVSATEADSRAALARLQALGVGVSIDDFGTGYSSLSRLRTLPVDIVKIDQSFIREIVDPTVPAPLVTSTIAMAHGLGLVVVAEGVETVDQLQFLTSSGCDRAQGYLLGRPMAAEEFRRALSRDSAARVAVAQALARA